MRNDPEFDYTFDLHPWLCESNRKRANISISFGTIYTIVCVLTIVGIVLTTVFND